MTIQIPGGLDPDEIGEVLVLEWCLAGLSLTHEFN